MEKLMCTQNRPTPANILISQVIRHGATKYHGPVPCLTEHDESAQTTTCSMRSENESTRFYHGMDFRPTSRVLMSSDDWRNLAFLEPLLAKKNRATINHGDKAMKSLRLF